MGEKMTLTFHSPILEEVERGLLSDDLEQRKEAFKDDEELMKETTKFVSDVIESATAEATRRKCQQMDFQADEGSSLKGGDRLRGWNSRARGFCNRILNAVCPCITTNGWNSGRWLYKSGNTCFVLVQFITVLQVKLRSIMQCDSKGYSKARLNFASEIFQELTTKKI